jgi:hypothetical protein
MKASRTVVIADLREEATAQHGVKNSQEKRKCRRKRRRKYGVSSMSAEMVAAFLVSYKFTGATGSFRWRHEQCPTVDGIWIDG